MYRVLEVSTSGYYAWLKRAPSQRTRQDTIPTDRIRWIHLRSRGTYGTPLTHAELAHECVRVGRKRVTCLMRATGLKGVSRGRRVQSTIRQRRLQGVICHSDQGSQYTSLALGKRCRVAGVCPSYGGPWEVPTPMLSARLLCHSGIRAP